MRRDLPAKLHNGDEEEFVIVERRHSITWELNSGIFVL